MKQYLFVGFVVSIVAAAALFGKGDESQTSADTAKTNEVASITHAHGAGVHLEDPQKLYIATHHGLLLLENGETLSRVGGSTDDLMGFSMHPRTASTFYSSGHSSNGGNVGFQTSVDGGVSWQKRSDGVGGPVDFHAMAVSAVNPNLIYGYYANTIQRSTDGGINWELVQTDIQPIGFVTHTTEENTVFAGTPRGLFVSRDRGESWELASLQISSGVVLAVAIHPEDGNRMLAYAQDVNGLGVSNDGGKTWTRGTETFGNEPVVYFAFSKSSPNLVYALTQKNSVYKSEDGGSVWRQVR